MLKRLAALSLLCGLVAFTIAVTPVSAVEEETADTRTQTSQQERKELREKAAEQKKERLETAKLRICKQREAKINAIMDRRAAQAQKHLEVFTKIFERTKKFYENKGNVTPNYEAVVSAAAEAKATAEASIATLKEAPNLNCEEAGPKDAAEAFKTAYQTVREDLKAYRAAIKDVIVAVRQAQGGLES